MLAIVIGCGGVIGLFYFVNYVINVLFKFWNKRILFWVYVILVLFFLLVYLILFILEIVYLSFFDGCFRNFVGLKNYVFVFIDYIMLVVFCNNLLWLVLVIGISVSLGLIIVVLVDKVCYEAIVKLIIFLFMVIFFVGVSVIWKFVYVYRLVGVE